MAGERLMCIWQAVRAIDPSPESGVQIATVMSVVQQFAALPNITYNEKIFQEVFKLQQVDFEKVKGYVKDTLRSPGASLFSILDDIEGKCWQICKSTYERESLEENEMEKMWCIFNRTCTMRSYPPTVSHTDAEWLFHKLAKSMHLEWQGNNVLSKNGLTFQEMIHLLDKMYFRLMPTSQVRESIEEIYNWLVAEFMKVGWLYKRNRTQSNWTNWIKRWFVMVPGRLAYYTDPDMTVRKGVAIVDESTVIENLGDYKGLTKRLEHRFKLTNKPSFEIELCTETAAEKSSWLNRLHENLNVAKSGITPITGLLMDRATLARAQQENATRLDQQQHIAIEATTTTKPQDKNKPTQQQILSKCPSQNDEEMYDQDVGHIQRDKVRAVFMQIDTDGNGKIDTNEFFTFIQGLGADMDRREADILFRQIDKDGNNYIWFEEFYDAFVDMVMDESSADEEGKFRKALLKADRDGSGTVCYREFTEFAWSNRRGVALDQLMEEFDKLDADGTGAIDVGTFKDYFKTQNAADQKSKKSEQTLTNILVGKYSKADGSNLAKQLHGRWKAFAGFQRTNSVGELVMTGAPGMVADVVPGTYNLIDLALFNDLPPIIPKHATVKHVTWTSGTSPGKSGRVVFPSDFNGQIPVDVATNEHLAYYGANLATGNDLQVSLLYRHGIQDFTYENDYLGEYVTADGGGAGIERHDFAHLDCPLDSDSGLFIIAKFTGKEFHVTAFKIPARHALYLPGGLIHSNDHLTGTWRTMLSDEAEIDHVHLHKKGKAGQLEKFTFSFI